MPTLSLRNVGMSYLLEGVAPSGLDLPALRSAMTGRFGGAVASMGTNPVEEAILIDRKAETWEGFQGWLEGWVRGQGYAFASWDGDVFGTGKATLHFHR